MVFIKYGIKIGIKSVLWGTNRNLTMDNSVTSVSLADQLLQDPYKLTIKGIL